MAGGQQDDPGDHGEEPPGGFPAAQKTPAAPITQVITRHCGLLPGMSMLAITAAARPGTIHALPPMTGSFVSDQMTYAAAGLAEQTVVGEELSRGFSPSFGRNVPPSTARVRGNKNPGPARVPADIAGAAARVRNNAHDITFSLLTCRKCADLLLRAQQAVRAVCSAVTSGGLISPPARAVSDQTIRQFFPVCSLTIT
jgi:hypothetical protein